MIHEHFHRHSILKRPSCRVKNACLSPDESVFFLILYKSETEWRTHVGDELWYVIDGAIGLRLGQKDNPKKMVDLELETGIVVCFWDRDPHQYYNADPDKEKVTARSIWVGPEFKFSLKEA